MTKKKEEVVATEVNAPVENVTVASQPFDFEVFYEKNKSLIGKATIAVAGAVALFFGGKYYLNSQNEEAQEKMFQAQFYFKSDSLDLALNGKGKDRGFLQIKDQYPMTDAANLASYYAGVIYLQKGEFKKAIDQLSDFSSKDALVQARAYSLIGDANMELNNFADAKTYYSKAAEYKPNKDFTPEYLYKLAIACEKAKDNIAAVEAYSTIINEYPNSEKVLDAKKYRSLLETQK
ncbi:MAG: tetratricopeptide repeat protein [Cytophagales bacterium]